MISIAHPAVAAASGPALGCPFAGVKPSPLPPPPTTPIDSDRDDSFPRCPFAFSARSSSPRLAIIEQARTRDRVDSDDLPPPTPPPLEPADRLLESLLRLHLRPTTPSYRTSPLATSFSWSDVAAHLPLELDKTFYVVAFRSVRSEHAHAPTLYDADALAHEEARTSGGILSYWYGDLDGDTRRCLAMCVWADREWARKAVHGPRHARAMRLASTMYETYSLERYWLRKVAGVEGLTVDQIL
ncbi:hypothetical protein HKX48_006627 [Thoreauomyces humboldtii]|nr:hypothetical protein HKX48_006627 [Thoreauomyces humboldtii]